MAWIPNHDRYVPEANPGTRRRDLAVSTSGFSTIAETAYEISACLVGSEMCIRDRSYLATIVSGSRHDTGDPMAWLATQDALRPRS